MFKNLFRQLIHFGYLVFIRPILFTIDPEKIHNQALNFGQWFSKKLWRKNLVSFLFNYQNKSLAQNIAGLNFPNPVGLAAGFDKNGLIMEITPALGFGFTEIGSITGRPCLGNPKPRLWRLPKSKSIAVFYGLTNDGSKKVCERLINKKINIPLGLSIAKTNDHLTDDIDEAIKDYLISFNETKSIADYLIINISCPNTSGGQPFNQPENLDKLLASLNLEQANKPIFIKLSPDLTTEQIDNLLIIINNYKITGLICSNLTHDKNHLAKNEQNLPIKGGLSGLALAKKADKLLAYLYQQTKGRYILIACGGIFKATDAYEKIKLGASLVQLITGMIYEGPQLIGEINYGLNKLLIKDSYKNISQAIGKANKN